MANNLQHLTALLWGFFLLSSPALAVDNFKEFRRDHWDLELGSEFFYSDANYSSGGTSQSLLNGSYFQLLNVNLATRYVPRRDWSIFGWGTVSNAESKNSVATRSNSSLSDAAIGFDFQMYSDQFQLIPEVIVVVPFEKADPSSDNVMNNEGVWEVRSRLIAQKDFGTLRGYGWLGFNYRGEGRSFLMPWGLGTQLKMSSLRFGAEVFGYQSATEDTDKSSPLRTSYINNANAGSLKFYSVNPNLVDTQLYVTWKISPKFSLQAQGGMTLAGANAAAGYHVGGFLRYSFDLTEGYSEEELGPEIEAVEVLPSSRSNMYEESEISSEKKVRRFRESLDDGVDQGLFKPQPVPKKKQVPTLDQEELQRQLDETEFNVELKSKKKRRR